MNESRDYPRWVRWCVGKPRIWNGIAWLFLAAVFATYGAVTHRGLPAPFIMAALYVVFGAAMLLVATHDRARRQGKYAPAWRQ